MHSETPHAASLDSALILVESGISIGDVALDSLLGDSPYRPLAFGTDDPIGALIQGLPEQPNLMIKQISRSDDADLRTLREARSSERGRQVPVLGVVDGDASSLDLPLLRAHGVVGVVDRGSPPERVLERIGQLLGPQRRIAERVRCLFPLSVSSAGRFRREFALNLSSTGMRITSARRMEPNTDMVVRFRLPVISTGRIDANVRVVHASSFRNSWGRFEIGVFFYPLDAESLATIASEVERLLAH